ncbi:Energy-coupling factor transporter ATP-binding protein EcfA 2 [Clostridium bornimense]|uniref:Energy-coupling factor transporter ATP-binding protein EcfA2 n=1 Tax=Clostridium bornimense TaxID=1216932 RepID=W6S5C7_9CLOT|nr:energy-coupling factor transporter ATPase [Clostridium bornimense]CDM69557.1 Energy-coupling factor transporter ATP-binding protein EcfA 2 [Clostridium bornimense]
MSIKIENLNHVYMPNSPFEKIALKDINLEINSGEFVALIGHTGSGKSTLIQHINGLLKPTSGSIYIDNKDLGSKDVSLSDIRKKVGLVFQYPEYQLFEETVEKDIAYGPKNIGINKDEEINKLVKKAMEIVGLDYEGYRNKSPFELSGGEKRRVAIAGIVAMNPNILILDEPTAGLDPIGRDEILNRIKELHDKDKITIIIVSHSMEDVARFAERIIVMNEGAIELDGSCSEVFRHVDLLEKLGLAVPEVKYLQIKLKEAGFDISDDIYTIEEAKKEILRVLGEKNNA